MPCIAAALTATPSELAELRGWLRSPSLPAGPAQRAGIIITATYPHPGSDRVSDPAITFSTVNVGGFLRLPSATAAGRSWPRRPAGRPAYRRRNNTTSTSITSTTVSYERSLGSARRKARTDPRPVRSRTNRPTPFTHEPLGHRAEVDAE
jgi:hypothetical protein